MYCVKLKCQNDEIEIKIRKLMLGKIYPDIEELIDTGIIGDIHYSLMINIFDHPIYESIERNQ